MVKDGDVLMVGGFGMTGNPVHLVHALAETGIKRDYLHCQQRGRAGAGRRTHVAQRADQEGHRLVFYQQPGGGGGSAERARSSLN